MLGHCGGVHVQSTTFLLGLSWLGGRCAPLRPGFRAQTLLYAGVRGDGGAAVGAGFVQEQRVAPWQSRAQLLLPEGPGELLYAVFQAAASLFETEHVPER